jgi:hypothetical protein
MIQGVVSNISKKPFGDVVLTSFALKGQDGWYSLGEHPATFNVGDAIKFEIHQRGKYTYARDIVPWTEGVSEAPKVEQVTNSKPYRKTGSGFKSGKSDEEKQYWAKKDATQEVTQRRIEIQAARNAAIETAKFMWEKELVAKPKKVADQYDAFLALVDQVASDFIKNTESRLNGVENASEEPTPEVGDSVTNPKDDGSWD